MPRYFRRRIDARYYLPNARCVVKIGGGFAAFSHWSEMHQWRKYAKGWWQ